MARQLLSPADDTASRALVNVQTATTRVKELVTEGVSKGWGESELTAKLNAAIAAECRKIENLGLREQTKKSLVTAARKWHYELSMTYRVLDNNLAREAQHQPLNLNIRNLLSKSPYEKMAEFRKVLDDGTSSAVPVIKDYQRSVKLAMKAMSAEPPKTYAHTGKPIPIRLRAEMATRYAAAVENLQQLIDSGVKFCWISSHPNCSPRCKDFQGKLYSLFQGTVIIDGKEYGESGTIDGVRYEPINNALAGPKGDGNGCISGYNCRHRAIVYVRGSVPPQDYSEAEIKREYAVDKQQRAYENQIRQLKTEERQLRACGMEKEAAALRKQWRKLTVDYQIYSMEHDRAFYPYRCVIDEAELPQGTLDSSAECGIIKETQFTPAESIGEAEKFAREIIGAECSYKGVDIRVANEMNRSFLRGIERCPAITERLRFIGSAQERNKAFKSDLTEYYLKKYNERYPQNSQERNLDFAKATASRVVGRVENTTIAFATQGFDKSDPLVDDELYQIGRKYAGIVVNNTFGKNADSFTNSLIRNVNNGYHPLGCDTIASVFDHELGHQIDYAVDLRKETELLLFWNSLSKEKVAKGLSVYATKNVAEFIAEGYAEYLNNPQPREISLQIGRIIEKAVKSNDS